MNFKRNLFVIISALVGTLSLSSCVFDGKTTFKRFEFIKEVEDNHETIEKGNYYKPGNYNTYRVSDQHGGEIELGNAYEVFRDYGKEGHIRSEGEQNIIVVPVDFPDYKTDKLNLSDEEYIDKINKAFFGVSENNAYVSVAEYFNRSSYGKLRIGGFVCDEIYSFPSLSEIRERKSKRDELVTEYYPKVIEWLKLKYEGIDDYQIKGLKTGKNIPIVMVYTYPGESDDDLDPENFFWAYTFNDVPLSWCSYSFM